MSLDTIKSQIPDYARDLKLNLANVLSSEGSPGLTETQIAGTALAAAISSHNSQFAEQIESIVANEISDADIKASKAAAAIMGMNNIYYRSLHLISNKDYMSLPAKLRMNVIANPGVAKADFEIYSLAVSAINGCGMCLDAHEKELIKQNVSKDGVQSCLRIAAVIHAVAVLLKTVSSEDNIRHSAAA